MFSIQRYSYTPESLLKAQQNPDHGIDLEPESPRDMGLSAYWSMKKSLKFAARLLKHVDKPEPSGAPPGITPAAQAKAKASMPAGARWITIHPNGHDEKGVAVMVQETGDGHAHVIAGAGGRLNLLKLNKIKSPEEYKAALKERKEKEKADKAVADARAKEERQKLSDDERGKLLEDQAAAKANDKARAAEVKATRKTAQQKLIDTFTQKLGWEKQDIDTPYQESKKALTRQLAVAKDDGDKEKAAALASDLRRLDQGYRRAKKSQEQHAAGAAEEMMRDFQRRLVMDPETLAQVESSLGTSVPTPPPKDKTSGGKGFVPDYRASAEAHGLTPDALAEEKDQVFNEHLDKLEAEDPETARFVRAGVEANRKINAIRRDFYGEKEELPAVADLETKTDLLKAYLEYKKSLADAEDAEGKKPLTQLDLSGNAEDVQKRAENIRYGSGTNLNYSDLLTESLEDEAGRMLNERQAETNKSLLAAIDRDPEGSAKWIANGNYNGLNSIALQVLKTDGIDRDVSDILGVGNAARLQAMMVRRALPPEELAAVARGMESYHQAVSESLVKDAMAQAAPLLERAESIKLDMADNPGDLSAQRELNEARMQLLDEANRITGQALGSLEASAAMAVELGDNRDPESLSANLGAISTEDAIVRLRALGLQRGDYDLETIGGDRVATIKTLDKLIRPVSPEDIAAENEVAAIKAGQRDEAGWLPDGVVYRPFDSFKDPGPEVKAPAGSIDDQAIGNDASTQEALHRTLGELPEAHLAYSDYGDLSLQDKGELRKYWEDHLYQGTSAEDTHGFGITRGQEDTQAETPQKVWNDFVRSSGGEDEALAGIKAHMAARKEDGFDLGEGFDTADRNPVLDVKPGQYDSYRRLLTKDDESSEAKDVRYLRGRIDDLESMANPSPEHQDEHKELTAELGKAWDKLLDRKVKDYYLHEMSGKKIKTEDRFEGSPWQEYVRVHGSVDKAMETVQDILRGHTNEAFARHYARVSGKRLQTADYNVRNSINHKMAMMDAPSRDEFMRKLKFTGSAWQAKARHAYEGGISWLKRGDLTPDQRRKLENVDWRQEGMRHREETESGSKDQDLSFFDEPNESMAAKAKEANTGKAASLGDRVEGTLKSIMPEASANQRRGQKFRIIPGVSMSDDQGMVRQRAIKMFKTVKRMNLTFGTGKGKTITSIGAFTDLKGEGKARRAVFAVPSVVQGQFGNEGNTFLTPGKYRWSADPTLDREGRIAALKDPSLDMVVATHQSLRDDLLHLMAKNAGQGEEEFKDRFNAMTPAERTETMQSMMAKEGINLDMSTVDESHYTVNRKGKEDATLANVMDTLTGITPYFMNQSATPVKNDISEGWDFLHKVAPDRFSDREEFIKRYGVDSDFSRKALQRLINRYSYASPSDTGVKRTMTKEDVKLHPDQQAEYDNVNAMARRASLAQADGKVDVEAMKALSPISFKNKPEASHEEIARRLQKAAGTIKEEALNRAVNQFDWRRNAKVDKLLSVVDSHRYTAPNEKTASRAGDRKPGIVFAHNLGTVDNIRQALESKGLRVGTIDGTMGGAEKDKVKNGFNPVDPKDRKYDVIVLSDAGATGLSLQNGGYLVNFDLPQTAWVKNQREGRLDRIGQAHDEIAYHDLVSDTEHEKTKWERIERKKKLGSIFEEDPGALDDSGLLAHIENARQERQNAGEAA